ncbi:MAG: hypothetical protein EBS34_11400 [Flavobacteriales bacterium]|nr:hypothetical protein [Flavobacteriales bacterium]
MKRLIVFLAVLTAFACSSERKAQYHYRKALKNGLKVVQDSDTIRITSVDSFPVIKNDTIVWEKFISSKDTIIQFRNVYVPKTRWQTRIEYKERIKTIQVEGKTKWKTAQAQRVVKYRTNWWIVLIAFLVGFFIKPLINLFKAWK